MSDHRQKESSPPQVFVTTRWSVVLAAQDKSSPDSDAALETLCRTYWYPLYAYVRSSGHSPPDAQDLTQEFFARLLAQDWLKVVMPERGRFRTFLLVVLKRFLAKEWRRASAIKRGAGAAVLPLDSVEAEHRFAREPVLGPDDLYERRWAMTLLNQALDTLKAHFESDGKSREFEVLKPSLTADRGEIPYSDFASALGISEGAARVAVHRLRKQFRQTFKENIAQTVANPEEVEAELRHLVEILGKS